MGELNLSQDLLAVTVIGCSGSLNSGVFGPASCYVITSPTTTVVYDLGDGAYGPLENFLRRTGRHVDGAVMSHLHPDHAGDVGSAFVPVTWRNPLIDLCVDGKLPVYSFPKTLQDLGALVEKISDSDSNGFDFRRIPPLELGETIQFPIGDIRITVARTDHPQPTLGLKATYRGKVASVNGIATVNQSAVFSSDTGPAWRMEDSFGVGADIGFIEATFPEGKALGGHHDTATCADQATRLELQHFVHTHQSGAVAPENARDIPHAVRLAYGSKMFVARQGFQIRADGEFGWIDLGIDKSALPAMQLR